MAVPFREDNGLTQEQRESLNILNSFQQMSDSLAWKALKDKLQEDVNEAQEALLANLDPREDTALANRWRQRLAIQRDLINFVESQLQQRQIILDDLQGESEE